MWQGAAVGRSRARRGLPRPPPDTPLHPTLAGAHSPQAAGSSPRAPPLPLELDSATHHAMLLAKLHGHVDPEQEWPAAGGGACTRVSLALSAGQRAKADISALALRLHLAGWDEAAVCLRTYQVMAETARRQLDALVTHGGSRAAALGGGAGGAAAAVTTTTTTAGGSTPATTSRPGQEPGNLTLELQALVVEVLGPEPGAAAPAPPQPLTDPPIMVPAATLRTRASLELRRGEGPELRAGLAVPALLVAFGAVPAMAAEDELELPLHDSLLGMRAFEMTLLSGGQQTSVGISVDRLSLWASPNNLTAAAVLAGAAADEAARLAAQAGADGALDAHTQSVAGHREDGRLATSQLTLKLNVHAAALLLSAAQEGDGDGLAPLFEAMAGGLSADVRDMGAGLEGSLAARPLVSALNGRKGAWEPVVEPWACRLEFAQPAVAAGPGGVRASRMRLSSKQPLELSVTEAAVDAAAKAVAALDQVKRAQAEPRSWGRRHAHAPGCDGATWDSDAPSGGSGFASSFWLSNQTGSTLGVWLARVAEASAAAVPPPECPPHLVVAPGRRVPLPVLPQFAGSSALHAGQPSAEEGVADCGGATAPGATLLGCPSRPHFRTLLWFQLQDQGQLCGPLLLDR